MIRMAALQANDMIYPGSDLKFQITSTQPGFHLTEDDFTIVIRDQYGRKRQVIHKNDCFYDSDGRFYFTVDDYGDRYRLDPQNVTFGRHPLLDACVKSMPIPKGLDVEISLHSSIPGGSSTGTSAAVTVALLRALDCLTPGRLSPDELAANGFGAPEILAALTTLEITGLIRSLPGGRYERAN